MSICTVDSVGCSSMEIFNEEISLLERLEKKCPLFKQEHQRRLWNWRQCLGRMNGVLLQLILGGFGADMGAFLFWVCWSLVVIEALVFYSFQRGAHVGKLSPFEHQNLRVHVYLAFPLKCMLILGLFVLLTNDSDLDGFIWRSSSCELDMGCHARATESLFVIVGFYVIEILLKLGGREGVQCTHQMLREVRLRKADFPSISLVKSSYVSSSVAVGVGVTTSLLVGGAFGNFMTQKAYWLCCLSAMIELIAEGMLVFESPPDSRDAIPVLTPEDSNIPDDVDVELQQLEDLRKGQKLRESVGVFPGAEGSSSSEQGQDDSIRAKKLVRLTIIGRLFGQGIVFGFLVDLIRKNAYFVEGNMASCDQNCRDRGRNLIIVCCVAAGLQAISFLTSVVISTVLVLYFTILQIFHISIIFIAALPRQVIRRF